MTASSCSFFLIWAIVSAHLACVLGGTSKVKNDLLAVDTTLGPVEGYINEAGVRQWKGIGYAKPPVGDLRWEYPVSPEKRSEVYSATYDAPGCPQTCNLPPGNCPVFGLSEDCLYLSVFSPATPSADPKGYPVHFWIHGGAFEQGLGNCALYNASTFAMQNITSVVINYRLGALGFTSSQSMKGNYGFLDQRMALQWTKDNIKNFGGNPEKITIAGQSAGAMSVHAHMISPNSKGLFSGLIAESNPLGLPFHTRESAETNAKDMFEYLGCAEDDVACMRTKSTDEVLDAQTHAIKLDFDTLLLNFLPFAPMVEENGEIPEQPMTALAGGRYATKVPMLAGSLYDEGQLFVYELFTKPVTEAAYKGIVDATFGIHTGPKIMKKYPYDLIPGNEDGRNILNILATDLLFYCPLRNVTRGAQQALGDAAPPTYIYRFKHVESFDCWGANYTFCVGSCCHGSELPFVFNVFSDGMGLTYYPNGDEIKLTSDIGNAWANFIGHQDPNIGRSVPKAYVPYKQDADVLLVLDEPDMAYDTRARTTYCDMWDQLGYFY